MLLSIDSRTSVSRQCWYKHNPQHLQNVDRGVFCFEEATAYLVESSSPTYDLCTDVCTGNKRNFTGAALTVVKTSELERVDGDVCGFCICITRTLNIQMFALTCITIFTIYRSVGT